MGGEVRPTAKGKRTLEGAATLRSRPHVGGRAEAALLVRLALLLTAAVVAVPPIQAQQIEGEYNFTLFVEPTPSDGGTVNPGVGAMQFGANETVTLVAMPQAGYQFVYWLGDVTAADTAETTVVLDAPKVIIAVFEKAQFDFGGGETYGGGAGAVSGALGASGGGGLFFNRVPVPSPFGFAGDFGESMYNASMVRRRQQIPEPTCMLLLAMGAACVFRIRVRPCVRGQRAEASSKSRY